MDTSYECLDYWLHAFLARRGQSGYNWSALSAYPTFDQQIQALSGLLGNNGVHLDLVKENGGDRVFTGKGEVEAFILSQPIGAEALVVGFDLGTQDNHAIYARHGTGGMSTQESRGWTWAQYLVYLVR
jgi:hypothetical protein